MTPVWPLFLLDWYFVHKSLDWIVSSGVLCRSLSSITWSFMSQWAVSRLQKQSLQAQAGVRRDEGLVKPAGQVHHAQVWRPRMGQFLLDHLFQLQLLTERLQQGAWWIPCAEKENSEKCKPNYKKTAVFIGENTDLTHCLTLPDTASAQAAKRLFFFLTRLNRAQVSCH